MNEHELEQQLRGWYRAEIDDGPGAPPALRASVETIPASIPVSRSTPRRTLLLAAVVAVVGVGGAVAIGSSLVRQPSEPPIPPSRLAEASPTPTASSTHTPDPAPSGATSAIPFESGFHAGPEMTTARFQHTATLLEDGRVLIIGGRSVEGGLLGSTETWDPASGSFTVGQPMVVNRFGHSATRLPDGRVVVIGGFVAGERPTKQIELWDPATGALRTAGETVLARSGAASTVLLRNGRVLIIGGGTCDPPLGPDPTSDVAARVRCQRESLKTEVWDPATEESTVAGVLREEQDWGAATLLNDGRAFVLGGGHLPTLGAETWDPASEAWSVAGAPDDNRLGGQTVTLLPNGSVAVIGGGTGTLQEESPTSAPLSSIEVWDPAASRYARAGELAIGRERHRAVLLPDGRILVVGGFGDYEADLSQTPFADAEIWEPATGSASSAGQLSTGRGLHTTTVLPDGRVLITGGVTRTQDAEPADDTASAEIWTP
jgi:hypothetical protein